MGCRRIQRVVGSTHGGMSRSIDLVSGGRGLRGRRCSGYADMGAKNESDLRERSYILCTPTGVSTLRRVTNLEKLTNWGTPRPLIHLQQYILKPPILCLHMLNLQGIEEWFMLLEVF